jgi:hypothetical protein
MNILNHFERHGEGVLDHLSCSRSASYFSIIVRLLSKLSSESESPTWSDAEAAEVIDRVRQTVACQPNPNTALMELEVILAGDTTKAPAAHSPYLR